MNPFSAGPLLASLNKRFPDVIKYEYAGTDIKTNWKHYVLYSKEIIEWVENMADSDWETIVVEKEFGLTQVAHSISPKLEVMFTLRWK